MDFDHTPGRDGVATLAPPPPGYIPNSESLQGNIIALHVVVIFFASLCVGIRIYTRRFITKELAIDDYLCIIAYFGIITQSGLILAMTRSHLGRHMWDVSPSVMPAGRRIEYAVQLFYSVNLAIIKLSCLLFFLRVFKPNKKMRLAICCSIASVISCYIAVFLATLVNCLPLAINSDPSNPGQCHSTHATIYAIGVVNVITDVLVLIIPLPAVWKLKMKLSKRIKVMAIFGLGVAVVAVSVTRLAITPRLFTGDTLWQAGYFSICATLELYIGMICACSLAFPSFVDRVSPKLRRRLSSLATLFPSDNESFESASAFESEQVDLNEEK